MDSRRQSRLNGGLPLKRIDCVGTLIRDGHKHNTRVLLVWNADWKKPSWSLPGGAREMGESLQDAARREVREETGLEVAVSHLIDVHEIIGLGGRIHLTIFTFAATVTGGSLITDGRGEPDTGGVSEARWFSIDDAMRFPAVARILRSSKQGQSIPCTTERRIKPSSAAIITPRFGERTL